MRSGRQDGSMLSGSACAAHGYNSEAHGVYVVDLFDRSYCERLVVRLRRLNSWEPAEVSVTEDGESRAMIRPDTRAALTIAREDAAEIHESFEDKVRSDIRNLVNGIWGVDLPRCSGTHLIRYPKGGHYIVHQDWDDGNFAHRYFTVLCYLNDNFADGGTHFPSLNHTVKPIAGKAVIFPSQYMHAAQPVSHGEKFVFVTWMCGPVPVRWL